MLFLFYGLTLKAQIYVEPNNAREAFHMGITVKGDSIIVMNSDTIKKIIINDIERKYSIREKFKSYRASISIKRFPEGKYRMKVYSGGDVIVYVVNKKNEGL